MPIPGAPSYQPHPWSLAALFLALFAATASAATTTDPAAAPSADIPWVYLVTNLLGGLALFLFGMDQMADGLKSAAGERMKNVLARLTTNRVKAATTGALVTAVIQSSSVTTVLVVGFVSAGLMSLTQSVGIIMGANIGTTVTAQIVAFDIEKAALAIVATGFAALFIGRRDRWHQIGSIVMGLGLVFFGMGIMAEAMAPLRSFAPFIHFMSRMDHPVLGILVSAAFTALVQSSSATTGIIVALASQGLIGLPAGIALVFGANVGTCVTALIASLGKSRDSLRAALVHILFNVLGVLLWLAFIPDLARLVTAVSAWMIPGASTSDLAADLPRQIANAHTIFNVANTLIMLPFAGALAWAAVRIVPHRTAPPPISPQFLDPGAIGFPSVALQNTRLEIARLCSLVRDMLEKVPAAVNAGSSTALGDLADDDDIIDLLHAEIIQHLGKIRKGSLTSKQSKEFQDLLSITGDLESIADIIAEDLVDIGLRSLHAGVHASSKIQDLIDHIHRILCAALDDAQHVIRLQDAAAAQSILHKKSELYRLEQALLDHQEHRFQVTPGDRLNIFRIEMSFVEKQRQIYSLIKRIARTLIPRPGSADSSAP